MKLSLKCPRKFLKKRFPSPTPPNNQMWLSGVVGVAGTQCHTRANERLQHAAYSSKENLFCRPNQHKTSMNPTDTHSQTCTVRASHEESKQTVQSNRFSKEPDQPNVLPRLSSTRDFATITQPIRFRYNYTTSQVKLIYQMKTQIIIS